MAELWSQNFSLGHRSSRKLRETIAKSVKVTMPSELLPTSGAANEGTVRNRTQRVGATIAKLRVPDAPVLEPGAVTPAVIVGLDGGYVRSRHLRPERNFEVVAGKVMGASGTQHRFAFARNGGSSDDFARAPVRAGVRGGTPSTVLSDGDAGLWALQRAVLPAATVPILPMDSVRRSGSDRTGNGVDAASSSRRASRSSVLAGSLAASPFRNPDSRAVTCRLVLAAFRRPGCLSIWARGRVASYRSSSPWFRGRWTSGAYGMSVQHHVAGAGGVRVPPEETQPVHRVLVFAIVALTLFMMSVDSTIVATALHSLRDGLHTSINWAGWTITAYSFGFVLMLPLSGKLSERYGRRRVFLGSVVAFTAASLLCGLATNIYMLIALRAVQAAGGAGFTPSATGIVVDHFGPVRDRAVSLFGSIFPIGAMTGPIFGGLFVSYWTWRGVFFVNVPIGMAVIMLGLRYIPRDRPGWEKAHQRLDAVGMALLGVGLLAGMFAVSYLGERNAHTLSIASVSPLIIAAVGLWMFFRHINRSAYPFIAPRLIHGSGFGPVNLVNALYSGVTFGMMALVPLYATDRYGITVLDSGTLLTAQGAAAITVSVLAALALRRTGHRPPLYVGSIFIVIGMLTLAFNPPAGVAPYEWLAVAAFLVGAGTGMINPASRNAGLQLALDQASTLAALRSMCLQLGSMTTVSIATAILATSDDPGRVQARVFVTAALLLVAVLPLIARVPEHRGSW